MRRLPKGASSLFYRILCTRVVRFAACAVFARRAKDGVVCTVCLMYNEEKVNAGDEIPTFSELVLHIGDGGIQEVKDSITSDSTIVEEEVIIEDDVVEGEDDLLEEDELF